MFLCCAFFIIRPIPFERFPTISGRIRYRQRYTELLEGDTPRDRDLYRRCYPVHLRLEVDSRRFGVAVYIRSYSRSIVLWVYCLGSLDGTDGWKYGVLGVYWTATNYKYYLENYTAHEKATNWWQAQFMKSGTWLGLLIAVSVILGILILVVIFLRKRIVLAIALIKEGSK